MARSLAVIISAKLLKLSKGRIKLVRQERPAKIGELPIRETKPERAVNNITFAFLILRLAGAEMQRSRKRWQVHESFIGFSLGGSIPQHRTNG